MTPPGWPRARTRVARGAAGSPVAAGLHCYFALLAQLVEHLHGKEGGDGSSPSEGSAKAPEIGAFLFRSTCSRSHVRWVWSTLWSSQVLGSRAKGQKELLQPGGGPNFGEHAFVRSQGHPYAVFRRAIERRNLVA